MELPYQIDKGIPLPPRTRGAAHGKGMPPGPMVMMLRALDVGDSFLATGKTRAVVGRTITDASRDGRTYSYRVQADGIRVWRTA